MTMTTNASNPKQEARAWQRMLSGRCLNLLDPSALDVEIEDIAHGLSRVARWNGQTHGAHAFSVAQHSLLVLEILAHDKPNASAALKLACLLHDAPEYVIGDLISPFKTAVGAQYKTLEKRLLEAIHIRYGLPVQITASWRTAIKQADRKAAYYEAVHLAGFEEKQAQKLFGDFEKHAQFIPVAIPNAQAKEQFLARFAQLDAAVQYA